MPAPSHLTDERASLLFLYYYHHYYLNDSPSPISVPFILLVLSLSDFIILHSFLIIPNSLLILFCLFSSRYAYYSLYINNIYFHVFIFCANMLRSFSPRISYALLRISSSCHPASLYSFFSSPHTPLPAPLCLSSILFMVCK